MVADRGRRSSGGSRNGGRARAGEESVLHCIACMQCTRHARGTPARHIERGVGAQAWGPQALHAAPTAARRGPTTATRPAALDPLHAAASPAPRIRDRFARARARRAEPFEFARCAPVESNTGGIGLPNQGLRASIIDVSVRK